jgi:hypothetical protein
MFFFEKKNQKTASALKPRGATTRGARSPLFLPDSRQSFANAKPKRKKRRKTIAQNECEHTVVHDKSAVPKGTAPNLLF